MRFDGKRNVFETIEDELKRLIAVGALKEGDKLPSVRAYAVERRVNPNTVAKAYTALEREGLIAIQPKKGAYVCGERKEEDRRSELKAQIAVWKEAGISEETVLAAVSEIYRKREATTDD